MPNGEPLRALDFFRCCDEVFYLHRCGGQQQRVSPHLNGGGAAGKYTSSLLPNDPVRDCADQFHHESRQDHVLQLLHRERKLDPTLDGLEVLAEKVLIQVAPSLFIHQGHLPFSKA